MHLMPAVQGIIRRRLLVNFRVDPDVMERLLPAGLTPKLQGDYAVAGICLIRLESIHPAAISMPFGFSSENAAHRVAVRWSKGTGGPTEGVYIPRRHTDSALILAMGGRVFPGVHERAGFDIQDSGDELRIAVSALARDMTVVLRAQASHKLRSSSIFPSLDAASEFFRHGAVGYSPAREPGRLEGLRLVAPTWRVAPLDVSDLYSSWFADEDRFPRGSVTFDCALVMRDVVHQWRAEPALYVRGSRPTNAA